MNRYIILLPENYDCYTVKIPQAIESKLTREEILNQLEQVYNEHFAHTKDIYAKYNLGVNLPGVPCVQLVRSDMEVRERALPYKHYFSPPIIYTIDEWFTERGNTRCN